ncbi:SEC10/PgrA surface exclusion domain-containing protein [Streptococcus sp. Z556]
MSKKKNLQVLTTGVALAIASIGTTALAQETRVKTTAVNEPAYRVLQNEARKSSDLKPQLDAQEVVTKKAETEVKNNQSELALKEKAVKDAQVSVVKATQAVKDTKEKNKQILKNASKADANRAQAIKSAETEVNTKNDAVKLAKEKLASANQHAETVESKLQSAQAELKSAQDKLANTGTDTVTIADLTQFKQDKAEGDSDFMTDSGATVIEQSSTKISEADKKRIVDIDKLTDEEKLAVSELYVKGLKQIRKELDGLSETEVTDKAIELATKRAEQYKERGLDPLSHGHIGAGVENLVKIGSKERVSNLYELKEIVYNALMGSSFADAPSKWGHLSANLRFAKYIGLDIANINGEYWLVIAFSNEGNVVKTNNDTAYLEKAVATAEANLAQAKIASENAKNALTKASTDYASALSLKTEAEKVLADAMATPLQAQVAENNLHLAEIALENAKKRETKAKNDVTSANEKRKKSVSKLATEKEKLSKLKEQYKKLLQTESNNKEVSKGSWIQSSGRWWYKHNNGSYTTNGWEQINGKWYHFDRSGWMQTGWLKSSGSWYYLNNSGEMQTGWMKSGNSWYYLSGSGSMQTGWMKSGSSWYYLSGSGAMQTGWAKSGNSWYYLNGSGAMQTGWFTVSGKWYYAYRSGALAVNTTTPEGYKVNYNGEWVK